MMRKLDLLLVALLLASALGLVRTAYESRRVFAELDRARAEQRQLDAEYRRLDAERQAQATHARVQRVAREQLKMGSVTPAITVYVDDVPAAPGGAR
jgi:cell division protein FtsL